MKDAERGGPAARRWIAAAALVGFALRLAFGLVYWTDQPLTRDEREYLSLARSLAAGHGYVYDSEVLRRPRRAVRPRTGLSRCFSRSPAAAAKWSAPCRPRSRWLNRPLARWASCSSRH